MFTSNNLPTPSFMVFEISQDFAERVSGIEITEGYKSLTHERLCELICNTFKAFEYEGDLELTVKELEELKAFVADAKPFGLKIGMFDSVFSREQFIVTGDVQSGEVEMLDIDRDVDTSVTAFDRFYNVENDEVLEIASVFTSKAWVIEKNERKSLSIEEIKHLIQAHSIERMDKVHTNFTCATAKQMISAISKLNTPSSTRESLLNLNALGEQKHISATINNLKKFNDLSTERQDKLLKKWVKKVEQFNS